MWLDLDGLRVIHACWDEAAMANLPDGPTLTTDALIAATQKGTPEYEAIETLLKGQRFQSTRPITTRTASTETTHASAGGHTPTRWAT